VYAAAVQGCPGQPRGGAPLSAPSAGVQDASLRLYMCVLLRARPTLASAVVMGLNGDRFLDVYVAELGTELRLHTADLVPGPVEASWNSVTGCGLTLPKPSP